MASVFDSLEPLNKEGIEPPIEAENELWLLSMPTDFPVEALNGLSLNLSDFCCVRTETSNGTYDANVTKLESGILPLIPSKKPGKLIFGSELVGCITVTKSVPLDDIEPPAKKKINPEVPDDLYQRWKPFGMEKPKRSITRKEKKGKKRRQKGHV